MILYFTDKYKEVNDTRIYDTLKARVTVPQAAARYGVRIGRNGMCCCPFHSFSFCQFWESCSLPWEYLRIFRKKTKWIPA